MNRKLLLFIALVVLTPLLISLLIKYDILKPKGGEREGKIISAPIPPKDPSLQKGPFRCPSMPQFCQEGKDIYSGDRYIGFGGTVQAGSPVIASFDGVISTVVTTTNESSPSAQNKEKIILVYLDNKERGLRAIYQYQASQAPLSQEVKEGDLIDNIGQKMEEYNASLIFTLVKNDPLKGEREKLTSKDFKIP